MSAIKKKKVWAPPPVKSEITPYWKDESFGTSPNLKVKLPVGYKVVGMFTSNNGTTVTLNLKQDEELSYTSPPNYYTTPDYWDIHKYWKSECSKIYSHYSFGSGGKTPTTYTMEDARQFNQDYETNRVKNLSISKNPSPSLLHTTMF